MVMLAASLMQPHLSVGNVPSMKLDRISCKLFWASIVIAKDAKHIFKLRFIQT